MNPRQKELSRQQKLQWQLTRERFQIADPTPPAPRSPGRLIGDILQDLLKTSGESTTKVPDEITSRWPTVVGPQLANHTYPAYLRASTLIVHVDHPGWLTEVKRWPKEHFLKKLTTSPDVPTITDMRFQLDPAAAPAPFRKWNGRR